MEDLKIYDQEEPVLLQCTDEDGNDVEFELLAQLTYEDEEYGLLQPDIEGVDMTLAPATTIIVHMTEDGEDMVMDPIEDDALYDTLAEIFENELEEYYNFVADDEEDYE